MLWRLIHLAPIKRAPPAAGLSFGLDAAPFAVYAALLVRLPRRLRPPSAAPLGKAVADGLRRLGGHRVWRTLAPPLAIDLFCFHLANVTRVLLARRNCT